MAMQEIRGSGRGRRSMGVLHPIKNAYNTLLKIASKPLKYLKMSGTESNGINTPLELKFWLYELSKSIFGMLPRRLIVLKSLFVGSCASFAICFWTNSGGNCRVTVPSDTNFEDPYVYPCILKAFYFFTARVIISQLQKFMNYLESNIFDTSPLTDEMDMRDVSPPESTVLRNCVLTTPCILKELHEYIRRLDPPQARRLVYIVTLKGRRREGASCCTTWGMAYPVNVIDEEDSASQSSDMEVMANGGGEAPCLPAIISPTTSYVDTPEIHQEPTTSSPVRQLFISSVSVKQSSSVSGMTDADGKVIRKDADSEENAPEDSHTHTSMKDRISNKNVQVEKKPEAGISNLLDPRHIC